MYGELFPELSQTLINSCPDKLALQFPLLPSICANILIPLIRYLQKLINGKFTNSGGRGNGIVQRAFIVDPPPAAVAAFFSPCVCG